MQRKRSTRPSRVLKKSSKKSSRVSKKSSRVLKKSSKKSSKVSKKSSRKPSKVSKKPSKGSKKSSKKPSKVSKKPSKINGLELLKKVLQNKKAQRGLVTLYSQSQTECTRNGVCGMEVGMSREKDQGAVLKLFLKNKINLDIDNTLPEDYVIGKEKISAKHSGSKVGTPVKAKWTSADMSVQEAIRDMIEAEDTYYPHLLITYLDARNKKITIICITSETNKNIIKGLGSDAFKVPRGNSRGIEYSRRAMTELFQQRYFTIEIDNADLKGGLNPIEKRINLLKHMGINP